MFRRSSCGLGYQKWPWPVKLPLKDGAWFQKPTPTFVNSVRSQTRSVMVKGDMLVCGFLCWAAFRVYSNFTSGAYQHRNQHLKNFPPAIIAQEFDFSNAGVAAHRRLTRQQLDECNAAVAQARADGRQLESVIFKF